MCTISWCSIDERHLPKLNTRPSVPGYSLWLIPAQPARSEFQAIIDKCSSERGTPGFGAHVTLIPGVRAAGGAEEVISKAKDLASELAIIPTRIESVAYKDLYFQCVSPDYVLVCRRACPETSSTESCSRECATSTQVPSFKSSHLSTSHFPLSRSTIFSLGSPA